MSEALKKLNPELARDLEQLQQEGVTNEKQLALYSFLLAACSRPQMFGGDKSFSHLAAFLDGYIYGLEKTQYYDETTGFRNFTYWLWKRLHIPAALHWRDVMKQSFPDDNEALKQLPLLYREYLVAQTKQLS